MDLTEGGKKKPSSIPWRFSNKRPAAAMRGRSARDRRNPQSSRVAETLDDDGLPPVGLFVKEGDPLYVVVDAVRCTRAAWAAVSALPGVSRLASVFRDCCR